MYLPVLLVNIKVRTYSERIQWSRHLNEMSIRTKLIQVYLLSALTLL